MALPVRCPKTKQNERTKHTHWTDTHTRKPGRRLRNEHQKWRRNRPRTPQGDVFYNGWGGGQGGKEGAAKKHLQRYAIHSSPLFTLSRRHQLNCRPNMAIFKTAVQQKSWTRPSTRPPCRVSRACSKILQHTCRKHSITPRTEILPSQW